MIWNYRLSFLKQQTTRYKILKIYRTQILRIKSHLIKYNICLFISVCKVELYISWDLQKLADLIQQGPYG